MLFIAAIYFYQDPGWNGRSRLNLTRAIVEQGTLQIDAYRTQPGWSTEDSALYNGHYYSDKAPGSALLAVPFYFILYHIATALHLQLGTEFVKQLLTALVLGPCFALGGVAMYRIAGRLGAPPRMALIVTLATAFGTMLWPYSAVYYGHVIAASFLILALDMLQSVQSGMGLRSTQRFFAAGLGLGLAFLTEYPTALIIIGLLVYALYVLKGQRLRDAARLATAGALGALIPLVFLFAYNASIYGSPLAFGYTYESSNTFSEGMSGGFMGIYLPHGNVLYHMTLDPKFGLLWLSPVLLLAPVGYFMALKRRTHRAESLLSLYAIGVMLLMNAGYYLWWGGNAFGPRLIIPALPFMVIPLALLPGILEGPTIVLGAVSIGQMLIPLMTMIQPQVSFRPRLNMFFVGTHPFHGFSILYQYLAPMIVGTGQAGTPSWNIATALHLPYWLAIPLLLAVEAAFVVMHARGADKSKAVALAARGDGR